jgi:hypothetical protein
LPESGGKGAAVHFTSGINGSGQGGELFNMGKFDGFSESGAFHPNTSGNEDNGSFASFNDSAFTTDPADNFAAFDASPVTPVAVDNPVVDFSEETSGGNEFGGFDVFLNNGGAGRSTAVDNAMDSGVGDPFQAFGPALVASGATEQFNASAFDPGLTPGLTPGQTPGLTFLQHDTMLSPEHSTGTTDTKNRPDLSFEQSLSLVLEHKETSPSPSSNGNNSSSIDHMFIATTPPPGVYTFLAAEIEWYDQLFVQADMNGDGLVGGQEGVQFLMKSGLSKGVLREIWETASNGAPVLTRPDFYKAMRLVHLSQNGYPIRTNVLGDFANVSLPSLPLFECGSLKNQTTALDLLFVQADANGDGIVGGQEGVPFLTRSGLAKDNLREIWEVASQGRPSLDIEAFREAMRLVAKLQTIRSTQEQDEYVKNMSLVNKEEHLPMPILSSTRQ